MSSLPKLGAPITSRSNARVKELRESLSGEARRPGDLLGLEGPNLIAEAHRCEQSFHTVYIREGSEAILEAGSRVGGSLRADHWVLLSREAFDSAVTTGTPQGIAATWIIREPEGDPARVREAVLVLEDLQDPGNLGTLIRTAAAFFGGIHIALTPRCANQWSPKVVRASAGAVFHTPCSRAPLSTIASSLRSEGLRLFAAVAGFVGEHALQAPHGVLFGRRPNMDGTPAYRDERGAKFGQEGSAASLSYDTDFRFPWAILIGNEGSGLSEQARALADEQVQIPCSVESLNAAVAGSILLYEAMRQLPLRVWAQRQGLRS